MDAEMAFPSARASSKAMLPQTDNWMQALLVTALAVQGAHLAVLLLLAHPVRASNVLQTIAPVLCAALCMYRARQSPVRHQGRLWVQLSAAFLLWAGAQLCYLLSLFPVLGDQYRIMSDVLWLVFAFPLLLVAAYPSQSRRLDPVDWLDRAQSCLLFCVLFVLIWPHPGIIRPPFAYHVEDLAMLCAITLRYSVSQPGEERFFFRNVVVYTVAYNLVSVLATLLGSLGVQPGTLIDLCWTLPFTAFCASSICGKRLVPRIEIWKGRGGAFPTHLHGISALGMAVMSLAGSAVLARHSLVAGVLTLIASTLLFAIRTSTREWQLHAAHDRLQHAALHDPLTGLANRTLLQQELTSRLKVHLAPNGAMHAKPKRIGLLFIDLDRFKIINDGLGHAFGDQLLIRISELLRAAVRPQDIVARHGGDEFVILLDQVEAPEAADLCQRVNEQLRTPLKIEDRLINVTASIGLVLDSPGATADTMLQDADCAMYKAKVSGKDRAQTFAPNMLIAAKRKLGLETDLRASLADHAMEVQYQPIYRLCRTGVAPGDGQAQEGSLATSALDCAAASADTIEGFEALARWRHPLRGVVSPADFIPIAEDTGLIIELGRQVLYQACSQCQTWNERFKTRLTVNVNVSGSQFTQPGLLKEIKTILRATGLDPRLLKLEITESVLLSDYHAAEEVLSGARALGIEVCLDDFGTGYSSLSYLLRFPFDVVKIDRSFVRHLDSDHRRAEMVRMVLQLAATLNKQVIAEGIESPAELEYLRELGCGRVQGFLLSRPLTEGAVERLLEAKAPIAGARQVLRSAREGRPWEMHPPVQSMLLAKDDRPGLRKESL
jgi:diguanylate cyclase (GGDEF)-like protein